MSHELFPDPRTADPNDVVEVLWSMLDASAPVRIENLRLAYANGAGFAKGNSSEMRKAIDHAITLACSRGTFDYYDEPADMAGASRYVFMRGTLLDCVYPVNGRGIADVGLREFTQLAHEYLQQGIAECDLADTIRDHFDLSSLRGTSAARVRYAIAQAAQRNASSVSWVDGEAANWKILELRDPEADAAWSEFEYELARLASEYSRAAAEQGVSTRASIEASHRLKRTVLFRFAVPEARDPAETDENWLHGLIGIAVRGEKPPTARNARSTWQLAVNAHIEQMQSTLTELSKDFLSSLPEAPNEARFELPPDLELKAPRYPLPHNPSGGREPVVQTYDDGSPFTYTEFLDGVRDGIELMWSEDGILSERTYWSAGKQVGAAHYWYPNGNLRWYRNFEAGKKHGLWLSFHVDGAVQDSTTFARGSKIGPFTKHYRSGAVRFMGEYERNGIEVEGRTVELAEDGTLLTDDATADSRQDPTIRSYRDAA